MRRASKLLAAVVVIACAVGLIFWSTRREQPSIAGDLVADAPTAETSVDSSSRTLIGPSADPRSAVDDPSQPVDPPLVVESELAHPFLYVLVVRTIDENGLPVRGAQLKLAPARSSLNAASALSEVDGWTTILWRGKQSEMDVDLQINDSSSLGGSRRVHVRAGTPTEVAVLGNKAAPRAFHFRITGGETLLNRATIVSAIDQRLRGVFLDHSNADDLRMVRFPHPHARFGDRFVAVADPSAAAQESTLDLTMGDMIRVQGLTRLRIGQTLTISMEGSLQADPPTASPETSRVSVRVLDDQGEPEWQCLVALGRDSDGTDQTSLTDEHGEAVFESVEPGWWEARAGGGAGGLARERLFVAAPSPLHWNARLDRGTRLIGYVLDAEGLPAHKRLVRYESIPDLVARPTTVRMTRETASGEEISESGETPAASRTELRAPWIDQATAFGDGSFEIPNLPSGLGRLLVLSADDPDGPALFIEDGVLPGEHDIVMQLCASNGSLHAEVHLPEPWQSEDVELRAISEATGRGISFVQAEDGYRCANLAPGWYRVEVGAGVLGWHDLGRHYVDAGAEVDIGAFSPPPPGKVRVLLPENMKEGTPALGLTFYLRRADLDIRGEPRTLNGSETLHLPAGEYWACWTALDGTIRHRALTLVAGIASELDLRDSR